MEPEKPQSKLWIILSAIQKIALVIIIAFIIRYFLIQPFIIEGSSMEPNYHNNQLILIDKLSYRLRQPKHGDVIVFQNPNNPSVYFIKRIIGVPGDTIKITNGKVYLNGQLLDEPYLRPNQQTFIENENNPWLDKPIPANEFFVMGDNRSESSDSREWGLLPRMNIVGRLLVVVYPFSYSDNSSYVLYPEPR